MTQQRVCFLVCPISDEGSDIRARSDMLMEHVIKPALSDYEIIRADKIAEAGRITDQIIQLIGSADLVVGDVTGHNPNVFFELGLRHAIGRPVIHMAFIGEKLPFDVNDMRTIYYSADIRVATKAKDDLKTFADNESKKDRALLTTVQVLLGTSTSGVKIDVDVKQWLINLHTAVSAMGRDIGELKDTLREGVKHERAMQQLNAIGGIAGPLLGPLLQQALMNPQKIVETMKMFQGIAEEQKAAKSASATPTNAEDVKPSSDPE